jgi:uncharacterized membrane protein YqjE
MEDPVTAGPGYTGPGTGPGPGDYPGTGPGPGPGTGPGYPGTGADDYLGADVPGAGVPGPDRSVADYAGHPTADDGASRVEPDPTDRTVGELLGRVTGDLSTLMRKEVELAKVEIKEEATKAGKASGMLVGAGAVGYLVLVFLALALMFALDLVMPIGWAAVITAVVLGVVAAVLFVLGRKQFQQVNPKPEQTVETLKEDVQWAKNRTS